MAWDYPWLQGAGILVHLETHNFKRTHYIKQKYVIISIKDQGQGWILPYYVHNLALSYVLIHVARTHNKNISYKKGNVRLT